MRKQACSKNRTVQVGTSIHFQTSSRCALHCDGKISPRTATQRCAVCYAGRHPTPVVEHKHTQRCAGGNLKRTTCTPACTLLCWLGCVCKLHKVLYIFYTGRASHLPHTP